MIELVSMIEPIDDNEEQKVEVEQPKVTKPITSTPTPITTTLPGSFDAQTGLSFTTLKLDKVRQDLDEAALLDFQLHDGRVVKMTHDAIDQYLEKTEKVKNVELLRIEIGKVAAEEVKSVDAPIEGGKDFLK
ncbi:hypothetical protein Tco_1417920 [Tanacetum coccineum]